MPLMSLRENEITKENNCKIRIPAFQGHIYDKLKIRLKLPTDGNFSLHKIRLPLYSDICNTVNRSTDVHGNYSSIRNNFKLRLKISAPFRNEYTPHSIFNFRVNENSLRHANNIDLYANLYVDSSLQAQGVFNNLGEDDLGLLRSDIQPLNCNAYVTNNITNQNSIPINNLTSNINNNNVFSATTISNNNLHSLGQMNVLCVYCKSKHFVGERKVHGAFKDCCRYGKVKMQERPQFPIYMKQLLSTPHFLNKIRSYNSALGFASMGGGEMVRSTTGPYCYVLHGQVYHTTYHVEPRTDRQLHYAQLYVVDTTLACDIRMDNNCNQGCDPVIMSRLDQIIREINPYARSYYNMSEVMRSSGMNAEARSNITMIFNKNIDRTLNRRNTPSAEEIAMIFTDPNGEPPFERDLKVYVKGVLGDPIILSVISPHLDPMTYVMLFPRGESGWQPNLRLPNYLNEELNKVTMLQYKVAQLAVRADEYNPILHGGKLFQQWVTDSYLQVESCYLQYIKNNQSTLKAAKYKGLTDYLAGDETTKVGRTVILPSTFQGSPRNMRERYFDLMTIVATYGKPDLFITMTCNPNWKEIKENLYEGQTASDRPDLVSRIFRLKLMALREDIITRKLFGKVIAHVYTIEFQKRGLPHAHMLFIMENKLDTASKIDNVVKAEIPNPSTNIILHNLVLKHMTHGPCGRGFENAPCMNNEKECTKKFPKAFNEQTRITDGYPNYKRSSEGHYMHKNRIINNSFVIPYNDFLLTKYDCHINVEVCTSVKSIKYICKYVNKGHDCANMEINCNDEVKSFIDARYISAPEAMWRLLEYQLQEKSHSIIRLPVHLPNEQEVYYQDGAERAALERQGSGKSMLIAWFKLNSTDPRAKNHRYVDVPNIYAYSNDTWSIRQQKRSNVITRMYTVSPRDREKYYLRLLLLTVRGAKSYDDLKTFNSILYNSFEDAAIARGLINNDESSILVMEEAVLTQMPSRLRYLFALLCLSSTVCNPLELFTKFAELMSEDFVDQKKDRLLCSLQLIFNRNGCTLEQFGLPRPNIIIDLDDNRQDTIDLELHRSNIHNLNAEQETVFEEVKKALKDEGNLIFLDGPAGTGKTFLYKVIITEMKVMNKKTMTLATTGIAADLLEGGRTVHSGFKLPVPLNETSLSRIVLGSPEALKIKSVDLILIDEVSMLSKYGLECINQTLKRVCENNLFLGGKTVLLGGDFRQTANVVPRGTRRDIIEHSIKSSRLWLNVKVFKLTQNMRCSNNPFFANWLLNVGEGRINNDDEQVCIPAQNIVKENIIAAIFGLEINLEDSNLGDKVILVSKNQHANNINSSIINNIVGEEKEYFSIDTIVSDDPNDYVNYPLEFLNSQQLSGMPPHILKLKVGVIVMLLRNLDPESGLLNEQD